MNRQPVTQAATMQPIEEIYSRREMASHIAAERIATALRRRLQSDEDALLIASGGSTPTRCLELLSEKKLDWGRVVITLSDERWVAPDDSASNERMLRDRLLRDAASAARFLPLYGDGRSPGQRCEALARSLDALPSPPACSLLGMGEDGHFASLFPDMPGLEGALDPRSPVSCIPVEAADGRQPRISLTLAALADSDEILLLIFGEAKRRVYEAACAGDDQLPISALLRHAQTRVRVIWAP